MKTCNSFNTCGGSCDHPFLAYAAVCKNRNTVFRLNTTNISVQASEIPSTAKIYEQIINNIILT